MITVNEKPTGERTYTVRVFLKSRANPLLRVTRQKGGIKTEHEAQREETRLKKECERELHSLESRGVLWCDMVDGWYEHQLKIKVFTGLRSKINHDDYMGSLNKWFGEYLRKPASQLNSYVLTEVFEKMKAQGLWGIGRSSSRSSNPCLILGLAPDSSRPCTEARRWMSFYNAEKRRSPRF